MSAPTLIAAVPRPRTHPDHARTAPATPAAAARPTPAVFARFPRPAAAPTTGEPPVPARLLPARGQTLTRPAATVETLPELLTADAVDAIRFLPGVYDQAADGQTDDDFEDELRDAIDAALEDGAYRPGPTTGTGRSTFELFGDGWQLLISTAGDLVLTAHRKPKPLRRAELIARLTDPAGVEALLRRPIGDVNLTGRTAAQLRTDVRTVITVALADADGRPEAVEAKRDRRTGTVYYVLHAAGLAVTVNGTGDRVVALCTDPGTYAGPAVPTAQLADRLDSDAVDAIVLPRLTQHQRDGQSLTDLAAEVRDAIDAALEAGAVEPSQAFPGAHLLRADGWTVTLSADARVAVKVRRSYPPRQH